MRIEVFIEPAGWAEIRQLGTGQATLRRIAGHSAYIFDVAASWLGCRAISYIDIEHEHPVNELFAEGARDR